MTEPVQEDLLINGPHLFLQPAQLKPLLQECIHKIHVVTEASQRFMKEHEARLDRIKKRLINRKRRQLYAEVESRRNSVRKLNDELREAAEKRFTEQNSKFNMGPFSFNKPLVHFLNTHGVLPEEKILEVGKEIDQIIFSVSDNDLEIMMNKARKYGKKLTAEMLMTEIEDRKVSSEFQRSYDNLMKNMGRTTNNDRSHTWKATKVICRIGRISEINPMMFITTDISLDLFPDATAMVPCTLISAANEVRMIYNYALKIFPILEEECNYSGSLHDVLISSHIQSQLFNSL